MSKHKLLFDITLVGVVDSRKRFRPLSSVWKLAKRNRILAERYDLKWAQIRTECVAHLRKVDHARGEVAA